MEGSLAIDNSQKLSYYGFSASIMCQVHNSIGSLTAIKTHLHAHGIHEFKSLKEVMDFQKNHQVIHNDIVSRQTKVIQQEQESLRDDIAELDYSIKQWISEVELKHKAEQDELNQQLARLNVPQPDVLIDIINFLKKKWVNYKTRKMQDRLQSEIISTVGWPTEDLAVKQKRLDFIDTQFDLAVKESSFPILIEHARKKKIIDQVNASIHGALGEQKVVKELEKLSDDYVLINDFTVYFFPALYHQQENDYIHSIQIDHLVISAAGVFLIETKNWSDNSINNIELRSPVKQVTRLGFAHSKLLEAENASELLLPHHWGKRKVPIKNVIVLMNRKPKEEFQFAKVLTLPELTSYIQYFPGNLLKTETDAIKDYLLSCMNKTIQISKSRNPTPGKYRNKR